MSSVRHLSVQHTSILWYDNRSVFYLSHSLSGGAEDLTVSFEWPVLVEPEGLLGQCASHWELPCQDQAFSLILLRLTHNEVKSDGLCSFLWGDSLHHHCIYICKANLHKSIWINLVSKIFRDLSALLKNPQALDILSLLLTLYVLPYSVVIHLGEVCSLKSTINFWFPQAHMEEEWKPGPREFLFAWIMPSAIEFPH